MTRFDEKIFVIEMAKLREKEFLKRIRDYDEQIATTMRQHGYKRVDSSERTVLFTFGEITFARNRWRKGRKTRYPVDEWLGLKPYMRYSPELMLHMAEHASKLSYREVCRTIETAYGLLVTKDAVLKAVKLAERLLIEKEHYRFLQHVEHPQKSKQKESTWKGMVSWSKQPLEEMSVIIQIWLIF